MQTGGFKGQSRTLSAVQMRELLQDLFVVPDEHIVSEYGMTELSSQMYELSLRRSLLAEAGGSERALWVPGWMRATPVDPETLRPVKRGNVGILRIDDVANVDTACCIQTADLAHQQDDGIVLHGRASDATPRGCSIAADAILQQGRHGS
jgi:hypothetical protein